MGRLTNRKIIDEILPILKEKEKKDIPELEHEDGYGHSFSRERINPNLSVVWKEYGKQIILKVKKIIPSGKYGEAGVSRVLEPEKEEYQYYKEYRKKLNGFYAILDKNGKITDSEWD